MYLSSLNKVIAIPSPCEGSNHDTISRFEMDEANIDARIGSWEPSQTIQHQWLRYVIATKEYPFPPLDNPSELQDEKTSSNFIFLVILLLLLSGKSLGLLCCGLS